MYVCMPDCVAFIFQLFQAFVDVGTDAATS